MSGNKIKAGLLSAIAYASGDKSRGKSTTYHVNAFTDAFAQQMESHVVGKYSHELYATELAAMTNERNIYRAGFIKAIEICDQYAVHLYLHGGSLNPIPECMAAKELIDKP